MIAAVGTTSYNILLVLHILTAVVAFAPLLTHVLLANQLGSAPASERGPLWGSLMANNRKIYGPALIVSGLLGFALAGMSDGFYKMSQGWLAAAFLVWIAMNGLLHAVLVPAERALSNGDDSAKSRVELYGGVTAVLLVIMLYLMVFKPGV